MNLLLHPTRPSVAGHPVEPGVPFSTRMECGVKADWSPVVPGHRAFIAAWTARRTVLPAAPVRRAK